MAGVQPIAVGPLGRPTAPALARPPGLRVGPLTALARDYLGTTDFEAQKTVADAIDANLDAERIAAEKTGEALDLYGAGRMWAKAAHERQQDIAAQEKQQEQDAAITEAQEKNAKALQQYGRDTTDYRQQRAEILRQASREIITQNQEREAAYGPEPGKFSTMTNFTRGQAAQRVIPRLGDRLTRVLPQARADARAEGNRRFNQVRDQVANNPDGTPIQFPADDVPAGVNDALALLRGSRTNISIFNDLLDRFPEGEEPPEEEAPPVAPTGPTVPTPDQIALSAFGVTAARAAERIGLQAFNDFVANVQATPGRPVTPPSTGLFPAEPVTVPVPAPRRVADLITTQPATLTWNDMQGYVTELGYRINAARNTNAPQDVATAMQSLRSFLQQKMMQIAEARNQGGRLRDANNFWADHMQFWFNSSSPIARAIKLARAGINRQNPAAPNANRRAIADLVGRPVVQPFIQRLAEFGPNGLRANSLSLAIRRAQGIVKAGGNEPAPLAPTRERFAAAQAKIKLKRPTEPEPEKPTAVTPFRPTPFRPRPAPLPIRPQDVEGWQLIGPETILRANQARAKAGLQLLAHQGTWILPITAWTSTMAAISIIFPTHTLAQGLEHLGMSVLSIPAFLWSRSQIVSLLSSPRVLQLLTEPTPDQLRALDSVPDRFRSDAARSIRAVATVARQQGIPVNPKLINWANQLGQRRLPVIPDTRDRKRQELMRRGRELTATPMQQQQAPAADLRAPDLQPHIPASDQVFATIASREGFVPTAWLDTMATPHTDEEKRAGGIWTIGYGRTENVQPGETTSRAKEEEWTRVRAAELQDQILASLNPDVKLNEPQLVALIDFAYHKGIAAFRRSTLLKELNLGHMEKVADEINRWVISRGKVQPGLINRAQQESEPFIGAGVQ
jgi:lysozyme